MPTTLADLEAATSPIYFNAEPMLWRILVAKVRNGIPDLTRWRYSFAMARLLDIHARAGNAAAQAYWRAQKLTEPTADSQLATSSGWPLATWGVPDDEYTAFLAWVNAKIAALPTGAELTAYAEAIRTGYVSDDQWVWP